MVPTAGEVFFLDTNILLSATDETRENYEAAKLLFISMQKSGFHFALSGQVIREYLAVATRPAEVNGFGLSPGDAVHNIKEFQDRSLICDERRTTSELLQHLVIRHELKGKRIHDANIIATMKTHGIQYLVTENTSDFECFDDANILTVTEVLKLIT